ncbi:MAG: DinB family protein [Saprospiraceae bacterium]
MKEIRRIKSLYDKLYDGSPWLDISILSVLSQINAQKAYSRPIANCNTIWEITNHIIQWREAVLRRVSGQILSAPANNYFELIDDSSEAAWEHTLQKLNEVQIKWTEFLDNFTEIQFDDIYPPNEMTYYEHIQGILQHDAYHLGQIVILAKQ